MKQYSDANLAQAHFAFGHRPWTCVPLALFVRFAIMAAAPEVREALCIGNVAVPINNMNVGDADGNFKVAPMVELTSTAFCHAWFWKQLGVKYEDFKRGRPGSVPLVKEIKTSIAAVRGKRKRDGRWYCEDGRPVPQSQVITVRDKQLSVLTADTRTLVLGIGTKELMTWFVSELSRELRAPWPVPIEPPAPGRELAPEVSAEVAEACDAPAEIDAEVDADAPGPVPIEDEGADEAQPGPGRELKQALKDLRSDPHIQRVSFHEKYGRFRVFLKRAPHHAIYVPVKQYHALIKGEEASMDRFSTALAEAVAGVQEKARPAADAEAVPLEDHSEAA